MSSDSDNQASANDAIVLRVDGIAKVYRIWDRPTSRIVSPAMEALASLLPVRSRAARRLLDRAHRHFRDFKALEDVSFTISRGESIGIIGRNGSGKSTLLQIVAGTMQPTTGEVQLRGRVAALLELGSGFNPEFTGRENVYLNAAVLGLTRAETNERFDDIASFADIGDFLDQPVKTYSSGMMVRLAFAVSVAVRPDILIVDEALAVGDVGFQRKCYRRIEFLRESGCAFLFVSHDLNAVVNLCHRAIILEAGRPLYHGDPKEAGSIYQQLIFGESTYAKLTRYGDGRASFERFWIEDERGEAAEDIASGASFYFCYEVAFADSVTDPILGFRAVNTQGVLLLSTNTEMQNVRTGIFSAGDRLKVRWPIYLPIAPGYVFFSAGCSYAENDVFLCRELDVVRVAVTGPFTHAGILATASAPFIEAAVHNQS